MKIKKSEIDSDALKVVERLRQAKHQAFLVGGCVRDLLLERKPKDFDVSTSATPQEIRRVFRNCRLIGRRFRLAHVFFGNKVIETSTFRSNPRELEEDPTHDSASNEAPPPEGVSPEGDAAAAGPEDAAPVEIVDPPRNGGPPGRNDLLIRRDNVFGTAEEDARRRDFTINGLFYDIDTGEVIDHVDGMRDLEARVIRTIGDPDIRFREDPIRILRAVKFAARLDLTIEPETYRRMLEHAGEITKCAQARVSEEFYRLLRAGAGKRSLELLLETGLLKLLAPELGRALASEEADTDHRRARLWAYVEALDETTRRSDTPPSNALVLATFLLPPLRNSLHPDSTGLGDIRQLTMRSIAPLLDRLKASRRDADLAGQILMALRFVLPSANPNRPRPRLEGREFFRDVERLKDVVALAEERNPEIVGVALTSDAADAAVQDDEALARELETPSSFERNRRGRSGERGDNRPAREDRPARNDRHGREERERPPAPLVANQGRHAERHPSGRPTAIPALDHLPSRSEPSLPFLGLGTFGGRWAGVAD